jgi:hypothetical protein
MKDGKLAILPKSQFLFHKNLPLRDFSILTLVSAVLYIFFLASRTSKEKIKCFKGKLAIIQILQEFLKSPFQSLDDPIDGIML